MEIEDWQIESVKKEFIVSFGISLHDFQAKELLINFYNDVYSKLTKEERLAGNHWNEYAKVYAEKIEDYINGR